VLALGRLPDRSGISRVAALQLAATLKVGDADAIVLSACVQMPSLAAVPVVEQRLGLPVMTATATVHQILSSLKLDPYVPGAGRLLARA
jgi:maleate isomerase